MLNKTKYKINEVIDIHIKYKPVFSDNSISVFFASPNIDDTFCNLSSVKLDTVYSKTNEFIYRITFSKKGIKKIKGYIKEYKNVKNDKDVDVRIVYVNFPILIIK